MTFSLPYLFRPSLQQAEYFRNNHKRNIKERKTKLLPCSHGNAWEEFKQAPLLMWPRVCPWMVSRDQAAHPLHGLSGVYWHGRKINAFGLGGSLLLSGQSKWNRSVILDNLLVCTFLLPSWLVQPFLAQLSTRIPLTPSQTTSDPTGASALQSYSYLLGEKGMEKLGYGG